MADEAGGIATERFSFRLRPRESGQSLFAIFCGCGDTEPGSRASQHEDAEDINAGEGM